MEFKVWNKVQVSFMVNFYNLNFKNCCEVYGLKLILGLIVLIKFYRQNYIWKPRKKINKKFIIEQNYKYTTCNVRTLTLGLGPKLGQDRKKMKWKQTKARKKLKTLGKWKGNTFILKVQNPKMFWIFGIKMWGGEPCANRKLFTPLECSQNTYIKQLTFSIYN